MASKTVPAELAYYLDPFKTRSGFNRAAQTYDQAAFIQREIGDRLGERLDYVRLQPERVVDLGCGTGAISKQLLSRYPQAEVISLDLALGMVEETKRQTANVRLNGICADVQQLPFQDDCVDLLISNLMLQWCNDLVAVFQECVRVLRPEGLFTFTTFGPDTLYELRNSWGQVDGYTHASRFVDMHDVGDALLQAGFRDPVMDRDVITVTYPVVKGLLQDLKAIGANNATLGRNRGLTGKQRLQAFYQAYEHYRLADETYPATYEVIFGHAWAPPIKPSAKPERFIPIQAR
ncbi:malonyl-ACP O-methyltransferase BioC [uncultured Thiothrix sp.]|uniref:malonyl-ACP O-methyltransferase BioC n=1 Tax=uncultured Thiothrix sp. TaxID=223185 RepID=UPI0026077A7B|nr:malonyl-ACP O-methyltransferase BioC [uncultured Thiothrix sp.]